MIKYRCLFVVFVYIIVLILGFVLYFTRLTPTTYNVHHIDKECVRGYSIYYVRCIYNTSGGIFSESKNMLRCECNPIKTIDTINNMTYNEYSRSLIFMFSLILFVILPIYVLIIYKLDNRIFTFWEEV